MASAPSLVDRHRASNYCPATRDRWTKAFPEIVRAIATLPNGVFDAELIVPDSAGRSDFGELQRRSLMRRLPTIDDAAVRRPAALIVFDVLQAGRVDMRPLPLSKRKAWLQANVRPGARLKVIEGVETHGEALFAAIVDQDFEGIVGKKLDSPYLAGRQASWQKIKNPEFSRDEAQARASSGDSGCSRQTS